MNTWPSSKTTWIEETLDVERVKEGTQINRVDGTEILDYEVTQRGDAQGTIHLERAYDGQGTATWTSPDGDVTCDYEFNATGYCECDCSDGSSCSC